MGIGYKRIQSLNASPLFIETLGDLVKNHMINGSMPSNQLSLRCPLCSSFKCDVTKSYFKGMSDTSSMPQKVSASGLVKK